MLEYKQLKSYEYYNNRRQFRKILQTPELLSQAYEIMIFDAEDYPNFNKYVYRHLAKTKLIYITGNK